MKNKPVILQIVLWAEVIISARVLLFSLPVLISKKLSESFGSNLMADWFVIIITLISLFYFLIGIASIAGHKMWRIFHYFAAALTFLLTAALTNLMFVTGEYYSTMYFVPLIFSVMTVTAVVMFKDAALQPA